MGDFREDPTRPGKWIHDPDAPTPDPERAQEPATSMLPPEGWDPGGTYLMPTVEPREVAVTAGKQDHSDPWRYAGEDADPPEDCGRPADG